MDDVVTRRLLGTSAALVYALAFLTSGIGFGSIFLGLVGLCLGAPMVTSFKTVRVRILGWACLVVLTSFPVSFISPAPDTFVVTHAILFLLAALALLLATWWRQAKVTTR